MLVFCVSLALGSLGYSAEFNSTRAFLYRISSSACFYLFLEIYSISFSYLSFVQHSGVLLNSFIINPKTSVLKFDQFGPPPFFLKRYNDEDNLNNIRNDILLKVDIYFIPDKIFYFSLYG